MLAFSYNRIIRLGLFLGLLACLSGTILGNDLNSSTITRTDNAILLESPEFLMICDMEKGGAISSFFDKKIGKNIVFESERGRLLSIQVKDKVITSYKIQGVKIQNQCVCVDLMPADNPLIKIKLNMEIEDAKRICMSVSIFNNSADTIYINALFPDLQLCIGDVEDNWYCHPRDGGVINNKAATIAPSQRFPIPFMQIMDVYNPKLNSGLYIMNRDLNNTYKAYVLEKNLQSLNMSILYQAMRILPGKTVSLPATIIALHEGDWHQAMNAYHDWVKTWYKPISPRSVAFREVFAVIRTECYSTPEYKIPISESVLQDIKKRFLLNCHTIVDSEFHAWGSKNVGDYILTENLNSFRAKVNTIKREKAHFAVYVSPFVVFTDSRLAQTLKDSGKEWRMTNKSHTDIEKPVLDRGSGREYYMPCPSYPEYQDYMAKTCARMIEETGADSIYWDVFGYCPEHYRCWTPQHNHDGLSNSLNDQMQMIVKARREVDKVKPGVYFFTEYDGSDVFSQTVDGAVTSFKPFELEKQSSVCSIYLPRFYYPTFNSIAMFSWRDGDSIENGLQALKMIFFNGNGIWFFRKIKEPVIVTYIQQILKIYSEYAKVFASDDCEPLIKTEQSGVYANRFTHADKTIYMLYNANPQKASGNILRLSAGDGKKYYDLMRKTEIVPKNGFLQLEIASQDVSCILESGKEKPDSVHQ